MATSADHEQHIKSSIVSTDYHNYEKHDTTCALLDGLSSTENSPVRRVTKSSSSSFKRVSFGNSKGTVVQTFIYESVPTVEEGYIGPVSPGGEELADGTESSPSKVKVTSLESQAPHSIPPPAALDTSGSDGTTLTAERRVQIISPPLPSLKKMEVENPFRPDGRLSHEVDPIVETYKHRPFPSGPQDSADGSLPPSTPPVSPARNGGSSTNGVKDVHVAFASSSPIDNQPRSNAQLELQHKQVASAKPGHSEVIHIEPKKKKCGCCSVQ